jgi:early secretory antigenic target protein ESAT-6
VAEQFGTQVERVYHGASKVREVRADVSSDLDKLKNVVADLTQRGWRGSAAAGFGVVMQSWDGSVRKLMVAMDEIARLLQESGHNFSMTDAENKTAMEKVRDYSGALNSGVRGPR